MGLSLTAKTTVWALVDTKDGTILADEVVALDSANEIARATARSIQTFALQTERDIDGVRMTWTDDARAHGIRLRNKLRLFGFETVETVSADDAREGRNQTARHIAPHLVLAYGAARAKPHADDHRNVLVRLASRTPIPVAAAAGVAAVAGVGIYALTGGFSSTTRPVTPAAAPAPAAPPQAAPAPNHPAPIMAPVAPVVPVEAPVAAPPSESAAVDAPVVRATVEETPAATPTVADVDSEPQIATVPHLNAGQQVDTMPATAGITPTDEQTISTLTGQPHLTGSQLAAGPVQAVVAPVPAQSVVTPTTTAPAPQQPSGGPLSVFLGALP